MKHDIFDRPFKPYDWVVCGERAGNTGDMSVGQVVACDEKCVTVIKPYAIRPSRIRDTSRVCIVPSEIIPQDVAILVTREVARLGYGAAPCKEGGDK